MGSNTAFLKQILEKSEVIFLDCDGTLFQFRKPIAQVYFEVSQTHGYTVSRATLEDRIVTEWKRFVPLYLNEENGFKTSREREYEVWREFCSRIFAEYATDPSFTALFKDIYQEFASARSRELTSGVKEFIDAIRSNEKSVGLLTNYDQRLFQILEEMRIREYFDFVFISNEIGYKKPAPEFFSAVQRKIPFQPQQVLYIGDTVKLDYTPALEAGWRALHYTPRKIEGPQQVESFSDFAELSSYF